MKKIMFNDKYCLTQAVLDGTKTMTRRILHGTLFWERCPEGMWTDDEIKAWKKEVDQRLIDYSMTDEWPQMKIFAMKHCRYKVGEIVSIAQTYKELYPNADFEMVGNEFMTESAGWNNKMFVRADLMKHHIRITDVKIERLQDILCENCLHEGIKEIDITHYRKRYVFGDRKIEYDTPREAFASLIDKVSGKGTWGRNPWMVAYSFELVD